jgi:thermitase
MFELVKRPGSEFKILAILYAVIIIQFAIQYRSEPHLIHPRRKLQLIHSQFKNWGLDNDDGTWHIHAPEAWKISGGKKYVVVAIIDTGIDEQSRSLIPNLWHDPLTGIYGWDFVNDRPNPHDEIGHGTHIAGIIGAALDPGTGIAGVAHSVSLMSVKYWSPQNSGSKNVANSIKAINWAIDHGANIINYSGGGAEFSSDEYAAIKRAKDHGILLVAAAGNDHRDSDIQRNYYYPCAYHLDNVICVASIDIHGRITASSNWGRTTIDVAAPGWNIVSTLPGNTYGSMSGTSQATAFVSGAAALLLSINDKLSPKDIKLIISNSVEKTATLTDIVMSGGSLNAHKALLMSIRLRDGDLIVGHRPVEAKQTSREASLPSRKLSGS